MSAENVQVEGPDLSLGVKLSAIADGAMLTGHIDDQAVVLVRRGDELFAVGAKCTHYGGPLGEGVVVGETIRCPWHHACFRLAQRRSRCGRRRATRCPAGVSRSATELPMRGKGSSGSARPTLSSTRIARIRRDHRRRRRPETWPPKRFATKAMRGPITMLSADAALPADRPNLSKDYLAGRMSEEWAFAAARRTSIRRTASTSA